MKRKYTYENVPVLELFAKLLNCKGISVTRIFLLVVYVLKLIAVMPVAFLQTLIFRRRINRTIISEKPIFILGHYRSGTTFLHKVLASDARFGFISNYDIVCPNSSLLFGKWLQAVLQFMIRIFKIKTSFFNDTILDLNAPAEEERFLINKGSSFTDYWRFVFPRCWKEWEPRKKFSNDDYRQRWKKEYQHLLKLITFKSKGKPLVLKSPPNTARIPILLEMFPNAKFIYVSRNPYHIFYSMRNLWNKAIQRFWLQKINDAQIEEIIFDEYESLLSQYQKNKVLIPERNLIEISYEELEAKPILMLKKIYEGLDLPDFESCRNKMTRQLKKENCYKKFRYEYKKETFEKIEERWSKYFQNRHQREQKPSLINMHE